MKDRIFGNPITTLLGIGSGAALSQVPTNDSTLEIIKYLVSVAITLWGLLSKKG